MTDLSVNISKTVHAPIERVYDAWLDPAMLTRFILPATGMPNPEVENDPREGGRFSIVMQVGDERIPHGGTYFALERPNRIEFSWRTKHRHFNQLRFRIIHAGQITAGLYHS